MLLRKAVNVFVCVHQSCMTFILALDDPKIASMSQKYLSTLQPYSQRTNLYYQRFPSYGVSNKCTVTLKITLKT